MSFGGKSMGNDMRIRTLLFLCAAILCVAVAPIHARAQESASLQALRADLDAKKGTEKSGKTIRLLNVSYDPTRELYNEYNSAFQAYWKEKTGQNVAIRMSHGGAGRQARSVIDGLRGDVLTLALSYDMDEVARRAKLMPEDWQARLPYNSAPYRSTIVFLVRKGNPKNIHDWNDLVRDDVAVITPNPKTSGGARWNYLAAWAYAARQDGADEQTIMDFMGRLFRNVPVLDTGARGSTTSFVQRKMGDVLLAWENEAFLAIKELGADHLDIIVPSISILAEPPVAVLDKNASAKGALDAANYYLKYLYSAPAQELIARHFYRPVDPDVLLRYAHIFPPLEMVTIEEFGGWDKAQKDHFGDGGTFDAIYRPTRR